VLVQRRPEPLHVAQAVHTAAHTDSDESHPMHTLSNGQQDFSELVSEVTTYAELTIRSQNKATFSDIYGKNIRRVIEK
jgi:hypothetical protein